MVALSGNLERSWFGHRDWSGEIRNSSTHHNDPDPDPTPDLDLLKDNGEHADAIGVPRLHALPGRHRGVRWMHQLQGL